jgi:hypothetical protein
VFEWKVSLVQFRGMQKVMNEMESNGFEIWHVIALEVARSVILGGDVILVGRKIARRDSAPLQSNLPSVTSQNLDQIYGK